MTVVDIKTIEGLDIAVVNADGVFFKELETVEEFLSAVRSQGGTELIAVNQEAFPTKFWDPPTGFPGRVLDRLIENEMKMAVVGDFSRYAQGPFLDFMAECNNGFHLFFVADEDTAFRRLRNALEDDQNLHRN